MTNYKSFLGAAGVAAVAALGMSTAALADEDKFGYSITIAGTSDYIFRGVSLTSGDPAFQPFVEFTYGNPNLTWYLDFWGSNVKDRDIATGGDPLEIDIYAGVRPVVGPVSFDFGVLYYTNPWASKSGNFNSFGIAKGPNDLDYVELKASGSITPITNLTLALTGYWTPDQGANYDQTETVEFDPSYTLPTYGIFAPTISGAIGYTTSDKNSDFAAGAFVSGRDYTYWNAGLKVAVDKYFMDFRYWDTSVSRRASENAGYGSAGFDDADSRFVFTAGVNLP